MENMKWPTWVDGSPVKVGELALSWEGPVPIHSIEITEDGFTLWARVPVENGAPKRRLLIDGGDWDYHPLRPVDECDWWHPGETNPTVMVSEFTLVDVPTDWLMQYQK